MTRYIGTHKHDATEEWRPIPGCDGYFVSSLGRVRSERPCRGVPSRILKATVMARTGYPAVGLPCGGRFRPTAIHRLVLVAFVGPCPAGHIAAHLNGIKTDNRKENLMWATYRENMRHKKLHGTEAIGERRPNAKLTERNVREIKRLHRETGIGAIRLAPRYGVSKSAIEAVFYQRSWRHVE